MAVKPTDLTVNDRELAEKANVAESLCRSWIQEALNLKAVRPPGAGIYDFCVGNNEIDFAEKTADEWCEDHKRYKAELERRRALRPTEVTAAEQKVAAELGKMREEHAAEARRIRASDIEAPGVVEKTVEKVEDSVLGIAGRMKENLLSTIGLGDTQSTKSRVVGVARLFLAAVAIFFIYRAAGALLGGGVAVAERSAERFKSTLVEVKDVVI